jgi:hypothetical protein
VGRHDVIIHVRATQLKVWHVVRQVTHISPAPCLRPIRFTTGRGSTAERTTTVRCGSRLPAGQQCTGCRHHIVPDLDPFVVQETV